jgi:hypothetical protein
MDVHHQAQKPAIRLRLVFIDFTHTWLGNGAGGETISGELESWRVDTNTYMGCSRICRGEEGERKGLYIEQHGRIACSGWIDYARNAWTYQTSHLLSIMNVGSSGSSISHSPNLLGFPNYNSLPHDWKNSLALRVPPFSKVSTSLSTEDC